MRTSWLCVVSGYKSLRTHTKASWHKAAKSVVVNYLPPPSRTLPADVSKIYTLRK